MKFFLVLVLCTASIEAQALRGVYVGLRGGPVTQNQTNALSNSGIGADVGLRLTKEYDLVTFMQSSSSGDFSQFSLGANGEMRIFRRMAELELSLGAGAAMYALSGATGSQIVPGVNLGMTVDFVVNRCVHLGTMARYHLYSSANYGSGFTVWMVRLGYYFSLAEETSMTIFF